ncbi:unnamed protein product [Auanema sp. JU1783]|nr:unnamed protein product [Auanema sp. JU1783]
MSSSDSSLNAYRSKSSFCSKEMKDLIEGEDHVELMKKFTEILKNDPLFSRSYSRPSLEEAREITHRRWKKLVEYDFVQDPMLDSDKFLALSEVLEIYDQGLSARLSLHSNVFSSAVVSMGTESHNEILEKARRNEIVGCFCLTELSHGSNTQLVQTTATLKGDKFIINTPNDEAVKVWAGNLAFSATHAVVFAQLYVREKNRGLHAFVLQVRDLQTFQPLPGIKIGDMGEKPGAWNAVENGWMEFKNHEAPMCSLLNKGLKITQDGEYISSYKSASERQSVSLGALSIGRIGIIGKGIQACGLASTIAIRYSVSRKQFGPPGEDEIPVLEYPLQQHRIFPYLASHIAIRIFHRKFLEYFKEYMIRMIGGEKSDELAEFSKEVHALSSSAKPVSTWLGVEALAEARRACGGHGFLHSARLNELRDSYDPSQTFEGENNILLQQTSNILLTKAKSTDFSSPMSTFTCLQNVPTPFFSFSQYPLNDILLAYKWLIQYLIKKTNSIFNDYKDKGSFEARNFSQIYAAHPLSIAYAEHTIISWFIEFIAEVECSKLKKVLEQVCLLYSVFAIEKHLMHFYIGGYAKGEAFGLGIQEHRKSVQQLLLPNIVALVDAVAPDDFLLHSTLGNEDGRAYQHLMKEFRNNEFEKVRPDWLKDLSEFLLSRKNLKSKL